MNHWLVYMTVYIFKGRSGFVCVCLPPRSPVTTEAYSQACYPSLIFPKYYLSGTGLEHREMEVREGES